MTILRPEIIKVFNDKSETFGTHGVLHLTDKLDKDSVFAPTRTIVN